MDPHYNSRKHYLNLKSLYHKSTKTNNGSIQTLRPNTWPINYISQLWLHRQRRIGKNLFDHTDFVSLLTFFKLPLFIFNLFILSLKKISKARALKGGHAHKLHEYGKMYAIHGHRSSKLLHLCKENRAKSFKPTTAIADLCYWFCLQISNIYSFRNILIYAKFKYNFGTCKSEVFLERCSYLKRFVCRYRITMFYHNVYNIVPMVWLFRIVGCLNCKRQWEVLLYFIYFTHCDSF